MSRRTEQGQTAPNTTAKHSRNRRYAFITTGSGHTGRGLTTHQSQPPPPFLQFRAVSANSPWKNASVCSKSTRRGSFCIETHCKNTGLKQSPLYANIDLAGRSGSRNPARTRPAADSISTPAIPVPPPPHGVGNRRCSCSDAALFAAETLLEKIWHSQLQSANPCGYHVLAQ